MSEQTKPKPVTLNRAQRRAILKPWRARKAKREADRQRAAHDIAFRERLMRTLRDLDRQKAEQTP